MSDGLPYPLPGSSARLSEDGRYRYELGRRWSNGPTVTWIMLNPSTADATIDDMTVRRCKAFSRGWDMGALVVVNLFALRSTDPKVLRRASSPIGPENDDAIHDAVVRSHLVVAAWGSNGGIHGRDRRVRELLGEWGRTPMVLGFTCGGKPRHPLYCPNGLRPLAWGGGR